MTQRATFAVLMLFISIVTLVSLYGWVTAVPASQEPMTIPVVIDAESWSFGSSPLLEPSPVDDLDHLDDLEAATVSEETDHSP
ncbi:MAG: hypothetical protein KC423_23125 [Anaerolineales bacterium]|nr:hypothetical protein [Anaerolineales bacterium]